MSDGTQMAVVTDGTGDAWSENREIPEPGPEEVLVRVRAVGICGSDIGLIEGEGPPWTDYPVVLGHEVCAEVVEPGEDVGHLSPGDRVALHQFVFCGTCSACRDGRYYQCDELKEIGFTVDGVVTHEFDLSKYETALDTVRERRGGVVKAVLRP